MLEVIVNIIFMATMLALGAILFVFVCAFIFMLVPMSSFVANIKAGNLFY